ncbi:hypothetical protein DQ520_19825, partial [Salmonella enterica]|nr:hypothetical protein [Salmonella enterica]
IWKKRDEKFNSISYFSGAFKWKAITLSSIITKNEVSIIEEKISKLKINFVPKFFGKFSDTSIEHFGCNYRALGVFRINSDHHFDDLGCLYFKNDYFSAIYLSIFKTPSGLFIINYYFFMKDNATSLISNIDVSKLYTYKEFTGLNIYKKENRTLKNIDRKEQAINLIENNLIKVLNEAKMVVGYIGERIGVSPTDLFSTSEFYKDQDEPYFSKDNGEMIEGKLAYIDSRYHDYYDYSADPAEHFFSTPVFRKIIFDYSYLLCKRKERFEKFDDYINQYYACYEKHLVFIPLHLIHREITRLISEISRLMTLDKRSDLAKYHDFVFECLSQTENIKKWLKEIEADYKTSINNRYHESISSIIKKQNERVSELLELTKRFYTLSESRVQIENIKYSKKNARLVLILVIVQIVLAAMTIDLDKKGQWYSPLVEYIKSITSVSF